MRGSLDEPPIVIRAVRWRSGLYFAGGAVLTVAMVRAFPGAPILLKLIMAPGVLLIGWTWFHDLPRFISPDVLTLSPEGLEHRTFRRTRRLVWSEVVRFAPLLVSGPGASRVYGGVSYRLRDPEADRRDSGTLPDGWEIDVRSLVKLLNEARKRWGATGG